MMHVKNVALLCGAIVAAVSACAILLSAAEVHYVYFDRHNLPDLGPFTRFEFSTVGHIYDASDRPLIELAREQREISRYEDIPPIVRDAILAAEDKRFFSHNGIDYLSLPRVLWKVRARHAGRAAGTGRPSRRTPRLRALPAGWVHDHATARAWQFPPRHHRAREQLRASTDRARGTGAVLGHGRTRRQHAGAEARRSAALVLARAGDAGPVRIEATREGRDTGPIRHLRVHGQRAVRIREGGGILLRPAARDLYHRRRRQGRVARGHCQVASRLRAERQGPWHRSAPSKPDADPDAGEWVPITGGHGARHFARDRRRGARHVHIAPCASRRGARPRGAHRSPRRPQRGRSPAGTDPGLRDSGRARAAHRQRCAGTRPRPLRKAASAGAWVDPGLGRGAAQPRWTDPRRGGRTTGLQRPLGLLQRLQPGYQVAATARICDEADGVSGSVSIRGLHARDTGAR